MTTPVWLTGFEHGVATLTTNGGGLFNTVSGSTVSVQSTTKNTGSYALKLAVNSSAPYVVKTLTSNARMVTRVYFYLTANATDDSAAVFVHDTSGANLLYAVVRTDGKFYVGFYTTFAEEKASAGTVSLNAWHYVDVNAYCGGTTWTFDWKLDGVTQTSGSYGSHSAETFSNINLGSQYVYANTYDMYIDDVVVSNTSGDYPIGPGGTEALVPASDGSHNAGTNCMENNSGTDIGVTTAYDKINSIPPSSTAYIRQAASGTGNYAEVLFGDIASTHSAIIGAFGILAYTSATTTSNNGGCIISKDSFSTSTTIWGASGALSDYSDGSTSNLYYKSKLLANVTDDTTVNALKARVGYSSDVSPNPYWIDLIVEVGYTIASGLSATVNQTTETDTAQALSRLKYKAIGQNAETDTAQAFTRVKRLAVAQVSETDTPQAISRKKIKTLGQVAETDSAQAITRYIPSITVPVGQVPETDISQAITRVKARSAGQVLESDLAQTITHSKVKTVSQISEIDLAQAVTRLKTRSVSQVTESDLAQAVAHWKSKTIAQVAETDTAQAISTSLIKIVPVGQVTESDSTQSITARKMRSVALVTETDNVQSVSRQKIVAVGTVNESDAALGLVSRKVKTIQQASETDVAQTITRMTGFALHQVNETDLAQGMFPQKRIWVTQAVTIELAQPIRAVKIRPLGQANETDEALSVFLFHAATLGDVNVSDRVAFGVVVSDISLSVLYFLTLSDQLADGNFVSLSDVSLSVTYELTLSNRRVNALSISDDQIDSVSIEDA